MKDLFLTNSGDISFYQSDITNNSFELNFVISELESLFLNFYIENFKKDPYLPDLTPEFILNFNLNNIEYDKDVLLTSSTEDYIQQQIKIRLDTAIGTLIENENIGSVLSLYAHRIITYDDAFNDIKEAIYNSIKDILPNAEIHVSKINTIYLDYSNSLLVTIKTNNYNYFYYL